MDSMPQIGAKVISRDDIELGTVKEIDADCFKIDAPMAADFWLGASMIERIEGGVVRLGVNNLTLDEVKEDAPAHAGSPGGMPGGAHGGVHRHT
jgi:hypothetical protein